MSLTSHLRDPNSPIGQFISQRFSQTSSLTKVTNKRLRDLSTTNPGFPTWVYSHLGMAIDYRIRYSFAITPSRHLIAWYGAPELAVKLWDSDDDVPFDWSDIPEGMGIPMPLGSNGLFDEIYRSNRYLDGPLLVPAPRKNVDELLAIPEDAWVDDLCALSRLFYDKHSHLLSLPFTLNPTFVGSGDVGGADADLIVNGCLIEIKTTIGPKVDAKHLRQLVGYVLLDYDDARHIESVGIYMARQGELFTWPIADFLCQLTGDNTISLTQLRQEFRALFQTKQSR